MHKSVLDQAVFELGLLEYVQKAISHQRVRERPQETDSAQWAAN